MRIFGKFYYGIPYSAKNVGPFQYEVKLELLRGDNRSVVATFTGTGASADQAEGNAIAKAKVAAIDRGMPDGWSWSNKEKCDEQWREQLPGR
jgi:hypothetical protein